jgi:hypothetical protein
MTSLLRTLIYLLLWLFPSIPQLQNGSFEFEIPPLVVTHLWNFADGSIVDAALPPEERSVELTEQVVVRLKEAEKKETDQHFQSDIRIAWITTSWAQHGIPEWSWHKALSPYVAATYQVLKCHPDEVWPRLVAERKAKLGSEYSLWYDANGNSLPQASSPTVPTVRRRSRPVSNQVDELGSIKKPCASTKRERKAA